MDLDKLRELAGLAKPAASSKKLNEHVVGDLSNGYNLQHSATKNYSDFFPTGNDYSAEEEAGPASAKQGDNPMQKSIKVKKDVKESKEIHAKLVYEYRKFKNAEVIKESPDARKALMAKYNAGGLSYEQLQAELDKLDYVDPDSDKSGEAYTDYTMRQGEMGNPDRQR